jgi:hypothetical protein
VDAAKSSRREIAPSHREISPSLREIHHRCHRLQAPAVQAPPHCTWCWSSWLIVARSGHRTLSARNPEEHRAFASASSGEKGESSLLRWSCALAKLPAVTLPTHAPASFAFHFPCLSRRSSGGSMH